MNEQVRNILEQSTTKTSKIEQLLRLGLMRREIADLVTRGNYGFVYNVEKKMLEREGGVLLNRAATTLMDYTFTHKFGIEAEDMPLKEVFKRISAKENGKSALSHKEPTEKILAYFEEIVPEYDKERVYVSDMKKIIQWYNLLTEKGMLDLDEEAKEEEKKEA